MKKKTFNLPCYNILVMIQEFPDGWAGSIVSDLEEHHESGRYNASIDSIESLILAHACAGIDISTPAYIEGVETAIDAISNLIL